MSTNEAPPSYEEATNEIQITDTNQDEDDNLDKPEIFTKQYMAMLIRLIKLKKENSFPLFETIKLDRLLNLKKKNRTKIWNQNICIL